MNAHSASCNKQNLADSFEIDLVWKLKHIILKIFWLETSETN